MIGYLTTRQAADYLGYKSVASIHAAIKNGDLRPDGAWPGGAYLWRVDTLDRFAASWLQPVTAASPKEQQNARDKKVGKRAVRNPGQDKRPTNRKMQGGKTDDKWNARHSDGGTGGASRKPRFTDGGSMSKDEALRTIGALGK